MQMDCKKAAPVGVFDSGVGGLTVAREISRQLPNENIVYFGDTARVPYGSKSQNTIIRFSEQIIRFLKTKQVKAIVIACNTASALALDAVRDEFDIPIMGVVIHFQARQSYDFAGKELSCLPNNCPSEDKCRYYMLGRQVQCGCI